VVDEFHDLLAIGAFKADRLGVASRTGTGFDAMPGSNRIVEGAILTGTGQLAAPEALYDPGGLLAMGNLGECVLTEIADEHVVMFMMLKPTAAEPDLAVVEDLEVEQPFARNTDPFGRFP